MITLGSYVIVKKLNTDIPKLVKVTKNGEVSIENLRFNISGAVGKGYGLFETQNGQIRDCCAPIAVDSGIALEELRPGSFNPENRKRVVEGDDDDAPPAKMMGQSLSSAEIGDLKLSGAAVKEAVTKLVNANPTFEVRTTYSQAKYVSKKSKVHTDRVYILKPTLRLMAQAFYIKNAEHIRYLKVDTYANIIHHTNIVPGCRVLVYDETQGLILAALLERLEGKGEIFLINNGCGPGSFQAVYAMGFKPEFLSVIRPIRWNTFSRAVCDVPKNGGSYKYSEDELMECESNEIKEPSASQQFMWARERILSSSIIDNLIFVGDSVNAADFIKHTFKAVRKSGNIVVYSNVESDARGVVSLLNEKSTVDVQIMKISSRRFQALSGRSHPVLNDFVASGIIVTATKTA
ncbi:hypothetical protein FO519_005312 [Halicephalobus sp. NKZ332]|nr:hypothetical protein FO519_005312 [Halicephalobus sp. NKZ332]